MKRVFCILLLLAAGFHLEGSDPYANLPKPLIIHPLTEEAQVFKGNGSYHLAYELYVSNFSSKKITLSSLTLRGKNYHHVFREAALEKMFAPGGSPLTQKHETILKPSESGIIFIFLTFKTKEEIPPSINHALGIEYDKTGQTLYAQPLKVDFTPPVIVSSPVVGEHWWTPNAASNDSDHRRAVLLLDGEIRIAQRFAVDWIQFDADGKWYHGDPEVNSNYGAYGKPAVAVADAEVIQLKDGVPENVPGHKSEIPFLLDTVMGNYVCLKINETTYALYAHLIPDSLRVKVGQTVKRGETLGLIGNSGNSTAPHLHFQITQKPDVLIETGKISPIYANGIPFALDTFLLQDYSVIKREDDFPEQIQFGPQREVAAESIMTKNLITAPSPESLRASQSGK